MNGQELTDWDQNSNLLMERISEANQFHLKINCSPRVCTDRVLPKDIKFAENIKSNTWEEKGKKTKTKETILLF